MPVKTPTQDDPEDETDDGGNDDDEDDAENNKPSKKNSKMKKSFEVSAETLVELVQSLSTLEAQVIELNKAFNNQIAAGIDIAKANAGAAKMKEAEGHVSNMSLEANKFLAALKETVALDNDSPAVETSAPVEKAVETPTQDIAGQIQAAMERSLAPVIARFAFLENQIGEVSTIAKAAQEVATTAEDNAVARVNEAISKAETELIAQATVNDIPNMTDKARVENVEKSTLTREEAFNMPMAAVVSALLKTRTK